MIVYGNSRLNAIARRLGEPTATGLNADDARFLLLFIVADSSAHNQAACGCRDCKTFRAARDQQDLRDNPHPEEN